MRQLKLLRWAAALTLAIALAPGAASAQETDTLTISSTFNMDYLYEPVGPDLAEVFANGHEHTWTLTLYGTSQSHHTFTNPFGVTVYETEIDATSFDLEFFGPDAATLNGIVRDHIAGGDVLIYLTNEYSSGIGDDFSVMYVWPMGPDFQFFSGTDIGSFTLFPSDADGYPVVGPDPFSMWAEYSQLIDNRPGNGGAIESRGSLVTFERRVGPLPGDFNGDDIVDGRDFLIWQRNPAVGNLGDWQANYGAPLAANSLAVPEPSTLIGVFIGVLAVMCISKKD